MKKLNRKGFTLVELLAVIIILAIVVGISIPAVLTTTSKARDNAHQTAVDAVADWLERQAQAYLLDVDAVATTDNTFKTYCADAATHKPKNCTVNAALLNAAGVKATNFDTSGSNSTITYNANTGRYCVKLKAKSDGQYQSTAVKQSGGC